MADEIQLNLFCEKSKGAVIETHFGDSWRRDYCAHLKSAKWKRTREALFKMRGKRCENCGKTSQLQIHHLNYSMLRNEPPSHLKIVCEQCHQREDEIRKSQVSADRRKRAEDAAFETWMRHRDMDTWEAEQEDYEQFYEWLWNQ